MSGPASTSERGARDRLAPLFLLPLVPWAWPALAALAATSEVPRVFGRWSTSFFAFNVASVAVLGLLAFTWWRGRLRLLLVGYLGLVLLTLVVPMNNQLRALPGIEWLMPVVRLVTGAAAALAGFEHFRRHGKPLGLAMGFGAALVALSVLDLLLFGWIALHPERRMDDTGLREAYALENVGGDDIVIVGDSFVWGQGVRKDERFGDVLDRRFADRGESRRVYSLGQKGFGLLQYAELLATVPPDAEARRVVVAFYLNDMPPQETLRGKIQDAGSALGRASPSLRLVGDKVARMLTPDVDAYHRFVAESWDPEHPTYDERRALLRERVAELYRLADVRSVQRPVFLILPLMTDFDPYPLEDAHRRVAAVAAAVGFEVLDLLPVFREELGDGTLHRNAPDDNHFDAATHTLVARVLAERL